MDYFWTIFTALVTRWRHACFSRDFV